MGKFIGNLVTKKKRKKLNRAIQEESQLQTGLALETADLEREAQRVGQTRANVQMAQERVAAAREARMRRAEVIQAGVNAGAGRSTSAQNAASSIYTQFVSGLGLQNVFAGFASELSTISEEASQKQSEIISSQGRQSALGAKLQTQQEKAELIGGAIDLGISVVGAFAGAGAIGGMASAAGGAMRSGFANAVSTASRVATGSRSLWGNSGGFTSIFSNGFR